jgi:hypothetical protein
LSAGLAIVLGGVALLFLLASVVPRRFLARAQDRLARQKLDAAGGGVRLLTRAELVHGKYRRLPGVLGLTSDLLFFEGIFGEASELATSRIAKIETGRRLAGGRLLLRLEVLRITPSSGAPMEFVVTRPSAHAWRSHLGLWAMKERQADADRVVPGR